MKALGRIPSSIYRLQLHPDHFRLKDTIALIPYLYELGVEGICCSPLFESASFGYDVTDPNRLNPALGSMEEFEELCHVLKRFKMFQILDIVPNHMGIIGNRWWVDVLEKGASSEFARVFDINWEGWQGKVLLPILNEFYGNVLERGDLKLEWMEGLWVRYFDYLLPLCYASYSYVLGKNLPRSKEKFLQTADPHSFHKKLQAVNKDPNLLHTVLEEQFYRLCFWKVAGQEINYRRFFNINELVAIHIEKEEVLHLHHRWIFDLIYQNKVQGLRVDHPDGLYYPGQYFKRILRHRPPLVLAEKILDRGELMPKRWGIDGTVGYEFLNVLSGLFVKNEKAMNRIYNRFTESEYGFKEILYNRRKRYLLEEMGSEIHFLSSLLEKLKEESFMTRDFTRADLTKALMEIMACLTVYRTYAHPGEKVRPQDMDMIGRATIQAIRNMPEINSSVFFYIESLLLLKGPPSSNDFALRFQQLTAPLMAKGLEDSTFYIYNRLISLNEVGGSPTHFGTAKEEFHIFNQRKLKKFPLGALPTSTHDTKFSEDARLRIHAITQIPEKWERLVAMLQKRNKRYKTQEFPEANTEYYLYQLLIALWPASKTRLWSCMNKAIREAGLYTSWRRINLKYETATKNFLFSTLKTLPSSFFSFQREIDKIAIQSSFSTVVLKFGSCGIVDLYQGNERLNYCMVDPDNRRPVHYKKSRPGQDPMKFWVTQKVLRFRREHKDLFLRGEYIPLQSPSSVIAFLRTYEDKTVLIAASLGRGKKDGFIHLPKGFKWKGYDLFTGKIFKVSEKGLAVKNIFKVYPFAVCF